MMNEDLVKLQKKLKLQATANQLEYEELLLAMIFKLLNSSYEIALNAIHDEKRSKPNIIP